VQQHEILQTMSNTHKNQNGTPAVVGAAEAATTTKKADTKKAIEDKQAALLEQKRKFDELTRYTRQHETLNLHINKVGALLQSPDLKTELDEVDQALNQSVTKIEIFTSSSRHDGYEIRSAVLTDKVLRFIKSELEVKREEIESDILTIF